MADEIESVEEPTSSEESGQPNDTEIPEEEGSIASPEGEVGHPKSLAWDDYKNTMIQPPGYDAPVPLHQFMGDGMRLHDYQQRVNQLAFERQSMQQRVEEEMRQQYEDKIAEVERIQEELTQQENPYFQSPYPDDPTQTPINELHQTILSMQRQMENFQDAQYQMDVNQLAGEYGQVFEQFHPQYPLVDRSQAFAAAMMFSSQGASPQELPLIMARLQHQREQELMALFDAAVNPKSNLPQHLRQFVDERLNMAQERKTSQQRKKFEEADAAQTEGGGGASPSPRRKKMTDEEADAELVRMLEKTLK